MISSFLLIIFGLIVMHKTRFTSIDNRFKSIDQKLDKLVSDNSTRSLKNYKDELRAKLLFKHLGIPDVTDLNSDEESSPQIDQ